MTHLFLRTLFITLITVLLGSGFYFLTDMEAGLGLNTLFRIRGTRLAPKEIVIVAMDETSEAVLGVGKSLSEWRVFHSKLIQELHRQGALLIVFDLQFIADHANNDPTLAVAMRKAGNVLLTDCVQKLRRGVEDFYGREDCSEINRKAFVQKENTTESSLPEQLIAMRKIFPTLRLAQAALDHAPFTLASDVENATIRETWTFLDTLAETPTLPILAWFYYLERTGVIQEVSPHTLRSVWLTEQRRQCLSKIKTSKSTPQITDLATRIDAVICQGDSRYLDFYGPPQTFRIESYGDVYKGKVSDLKGKVVFVGKANRKYSSGKEDFFQTPFTDTHSGKMAGVEIMATQFADLLEGRFIEFPIPHLLCLLIFGLMISFLVAQFAGLTGMLISLLFSSVYAGFAVWLFSRDGFWFPLIVPLIQLVSAWLISLLWSRRDLLMERKRIFAFVSKLFPQWIHFVPGLPGQWDPKKNADQLESRDVFGICLATDIEGYTAIAAQYTPHQMWNLLKAYYQVLGYPVSSFDGKIANIQGDAMMALWIDLAPETQRQAACLAALEIQLSVAQFNQSSSVGCLPTRIGLHEGEIVLGSGEAGSFKIFNPFGDTVNIASRIEGVNKYLGTQILASATIVANLSHIVYRPVGLFRVMGREEPLALVEIVARTAETADATHALHKQFARGLSAFQQGLWKEAIINFQALLANFGADGPSRFYLKLAQTYLDNPPLEWDGVVQLDGK